MLNRYLAAVCVLIFLAPFATAQKTASLDEKQFSVQLPAAPNSVREVGDKLDGTGRKTKSWKGKSGDLEFELIAVDYSKADLRNSNAGDYINSYCNGEVNNANRLKAKILDDKLTTRDGNLVQALIYEADKKQTRFAWYAQGDRVYQLKANGPKTSMESAEAKRFFDSFRLKK